MSTKRFTYAPIYPGFAWAATVTITSAATLFPAGAALRAQVRAEVDGDVLATLTTAAGTLTAPADNRFQVSMTAAQTKAFTEGSILFDVVRTDGPQAPQHLGLRITVEVDLSATTAA